MTTYTKSISFHSMSFHSMSFHNKISICRNMSRVSNVLNELRRCLPYVTPCYAVTCNSSPNLVSYLREQNVELIHTHDNVVRNRHDNVVRNVNDIKQLTATTQARARAPPPLLWVKTAVSNEGVERTREMFEYIWAHKCILNGIVFDIHNFTNGYIPPTMYSYKIATEYVFRNMVLPFEREYGIQTPAIMIDGQDHITQIRHLSELHFYALNETTIINGFTQKKPELRLILGALFDSVGGGGGGGGDIVCTRRRLSAHEYP
jgi:hypothetical protein